MLSSPFPFEFWLAFSNPIQVYLDLFSCLAGIVAYESLFFGLFSINSEDLIHRPFAKSPIKIEIVNPFKLTSKKLITPEKL